MGAVLCSAVNRVGERWGGRGVGGEQGKVCPGRWCRCGEGKMARAEPSRPEGGGESLPGRVRVCGAGRARRSQRRRHRTAGGPGLLPRGGSGAQRCPAGEEGKGDRRAPVPHCCTAGMKEGESLGSSSESDLLGELSRPKPGLVSRIK